MLALGLDTSTGSGSVGLTDGQGLAAELNLRSATTHSGRLLPSVQALLAAAGETLDRIDLLAVACGPGSFTGLRIGMATARGLALSIGRPVTGFSTLQMIALACAASWPEAARMPVCVVLDAGKGEVYRGLFKCEGDDIVGLEPEAAMAPREAERRMPDPCLVCGDGVPACGGALQRAHVGGRIFMSAVPSIGLALARRAVAVAGRHGLAGLAPLVPNYLRLSEAEIHFKE